jgi:hypothetical protein
VWQEAPTFQGPERFDFLQKIASQRMARVTALVDALAKPWTDFYVPTPIDETWYINYRLA